MVVLDGVAGLRVVVGAAKVDEVGVEEHEHVLGWVRRDGDRGKALRGVQIRVIQNSACIKLMRKFVGSQSPAEMEVYA